MRCNNISSVTLININSYVSIKRYYRVRYIVLSVVQILISNNNSFTNFFLIFFAKFRAVQMNYCIEKLSGRISQLIYCRNLRFRGNLLCLFD